jgi:hypothetical protein
MDTNIINQAKAIELIKNGFFNSEYQIVFDNTTIDALDVILLGKNGVDVPENLINYNDSNLDYSDIPPITDEDIETGKIKWIINAEIPLESEISNWIKIQNIDINQLTTQLIKNFYQTMINIQKNAAL